MRDGVLKVESSVNFHRCYRKGCGATATHMPALPCLSERGEKVLWAMAVPHCEPHTKGAVVDGMMTESAWQQLRDMMTKEGLIVPDKATPLRFVQFSAMRGA